MSKLFGSIAGVVTRRPALSLGLLAVVTAVLLGGMSLLAPQAGNEVFLPADSEVAAASDTLADAFPDTAGLSAVTIIHRGEFLTSEGLTQIDNVLAAAVDDPGVQERLALTNPVASVAAAFKQALGVADFTGVSQEQIDAAAATPQLAALLGNLSGTADGEPLVISSVKLRSLDDVDGRNDVELLIADAVETVDGCLLYTSPSPRDKRQSRMPSSA